VTTEEYKFHYEWFGFTFTVCEKRSEVKARQFLGNWTTDTLLIKSIMDVALSGPGKLRITLSDGKAREYQLGLKADGARVSIIALT